MTSWNNRNKQKYVRWLAVFLAFAIALPFAVVLLSSPEDEDSQRQEDSSLYEESPPSVQEVVSDSSEVSPTALPFTIEQEPQNRAPVIGIDGPECFSSLFEDNLIPISISVSDEDDTSVTLDLAAQIGDEVLDLTEYIVEGTYLIVPGTSTASLPIPDEIGSYLLLIAHATDSDGASSETALVIPNRCPSTE
ncbi:MAG: hypothetical protein QF596_04235 [Acidimicrobiales bacterium]|jgi:hypothetical protein|nr:hypothetical protein [Acidimicrobiales bacterium]MDP6297880.1 hypothetical protein [Acidimicrobiales bacterium]HJM29177.1 hypothetical protein [Acidimicrobiales bacterium]HJM97587.1 hypothetical protein [Acidimicrobiales bacterium]